MIEIRHPLPALLFIPFAIAQTAQQSAQSPPPQQPATQNPVVRSIRFKLSAGDLPSAESLLEEYKAGAGADAVYIVAASWVARGAALMHDWAAAEHYSALAREMAAHATDSDLLYALGSAIEVHAQVLEAQGQKQEAASFIDSQLKIDADAPVSFRCRLYKRRNLIALAGRPAPGITADDGTSWKPAKGKPSILFLWANYCSDCLGEEPALARFWQKYRGRGIQLAAITRVYDDDEAAADRAKTAEVWRTSYKELADVPVIVSTGAMLRYGGSSTPTFVFIDGNGVVRAYLPWRLTEDRLEEETDKLLGNPAPIGASHVSLQSLSMSASPQSSESAARAFADAINGHNADDLAALMTEDHVFIDSLGNRVAGREAMRKGWIAYFGMVPDYTIAIHETYSNDRTVIMLGTAQGTLAVDGHLPPQNHWQTPAAWRAEIRDGQVASWQVYADNEPIRRLLAHKTK
jgi:ketosteroid isomerase-like protein/thiol-disulfide isomerase/thioredoxin